MPCDNFQPQTWRPSKCKECFCARSEHVTQEVPTTSDNKQEEEKKVSRGEVTRRLSEMRENNIVHQLSGRTRRGQPERNQNIRRLAREARQGEQEPADGANNVLQARAMVLGDIQQFRLADENEVPEVVPEEVQEQALTQQEEEQKEEDETEDKKQEVPVPQAPAVVPVALPVAAPAVVAPAVVVPERKGGGIPFNAAMLQDVKLAKVEVKEKPLISGHSDAMEFALRKRQNKKLDYWRRKLGEEGLNELSECCREIDGAQQGEGLTTEQLCTLAQRVQGLETQYGVDKDTMSRLSETQEHKFNVEFVSELSAVNHRIEALKRSIASVGRLSETKAKRVEACERTMGDVVKLFVEMSAEQSVVWNQESRIEYLDACREQVKNGVHDIFTFLNNVGFTYYNDFCRTSSASRKLSKFDRESAARAAYRICDTVETLIVELRSLELLDNDSKCAERRAELIDILLKVSALSKDVIVHILEPYDSGLADFASIKEHIAQSVFIEGVNDSEFGPTRREVLSY